MESFIKQPSEACWKAIDFSARLENVTTPTVSDTITAITSALSYNEATGLADTTVLGSGVNVPYISGVYVYFLAQAGVHGSTYRYTVKITTSSGQIAEKDILMKVKEIS